MKLRANILSVFLLFISTTIWSQEVKTIRDVGLWTNLGINKKLNKNWSTTASIKTRSFDNFTKLSGVLTDVGLDYKINKKFGLGSSVRYAYDRKKDFTYVQEIRYNFDLNYNHKINKKIEFNYRLRFQNNYSNIFTYPIAFENIANLRNRIKIAYKLDKCKVYFSSELFREFVFYKRPYFNNIRFVLGNTRNIKSRKFDFAIAYEHELNEEFPLNFFFVKLNYTFKLKTSKGKKDD